MALIIHYPFTDGLIDITQNQNNLVYNNNSGALGQALDGKIGKCEERKVYNTTDYYRSENKITLGSDFTMCCWAYVTQCGSSANGLITNHNNSTNSGAGITVKHISDTDFRISCNTGNGVDRTFNTHYGTSNIKDKWSHLTIRYDKGLQELTLLVNGIVEKTVSYPMYSPENYLDIFNWSTSYTHSSDYRPVAKLNDVRVYDNALSNKEIYDIAQGKLLHYKFNNFQEPTENTLKEQQPPLPGTYTNVTTQVLQTSETISGYESKVICDPVLPINLAARINLGGQIDNSGNTITVSAYLKMDMEFATSTTRSPRMYSSDIGWVDMYPINKNESDYMTGKYKRFSATVDKITSEVIGIGTVNVTEEIGYIADMQIEVKEYQTPYTLDIRDGIVKDSSGFGNNSILELETTPKWNIESKLGTGSYQFFTGENKIILSSDSIQSVQYTEMTASAWIKIENGELQYSDWGSYVVHNGVDASVGSSIYTIAVKPTGEAVWAWSGVYAPMTTTEKYNDGEWHLLTGVWDGVSSILYVDGVEAIRTGLTSNRSGNSGLFEIGGTTLRPTTNAFRHFNGRIDDVRIYARALSSSEILNLYQSRFNIDDKGRFSLNELNNLELSNIYNLDKYNLVTNGNQQTGDNTNFSGFTYIDTGETGFEEDVRYTTKFTDEYIDFDFRDMEKECFLSFTLKNNSGNGQEHRNYSGIYCLDKNKDSIPTRYVKHYTSTETTLAQDLNNGDTIVYLTSAANWKTGIDAVSQRYIGIHNLPEYPPYTYTNKVYAFDTSEIITNTLTLTSPYSGDTVIAGTKVANQYDGGTYDYITSGNALLVDGQEETYSTTFDYTTLRYGTKYIKPLMLLNRNVDTGLPYKTLVKEIIVDGKYGDFEKDKKVSFLANGVCQSNIDEIGIIEGLSGYWKFDTLNDSSLEQNDLNNFGVSLASGIAEFDGISSLTTANNDAVDLDYITIIQVIRVADNLFVGDNILINKDQSYETKIAIGTDTAVYQSAIRTVNSGTWSWKGTTNIPLSEWVFVATVWDGVNITNYVNDIKTEFLNISTGSMYRTTSGLGIGARGIPSDGGSKGSAFFKGDMKETRIYNRVLTEDEVFTLYKVMMKQTASIKDNVFYVNEIKEI